MGREPFLGFGLSPSGNSLIEFGHISGSCMPNVLGHGNDWSEKKRQERDHSLHHERGRSDGELAWCEMASTSTNSVVDSCLDHLLFGLGKLRPHGSTLHFARANKTSCSIFEVIYPVQLKMRAQETLDSGNLQSTNLRPILAPSRALQRPSPLCNDDLFVSTLEWDAVPHVRPFIDPIAFSKTPAPGGRRKRLATEMQVSISPEVWLSSVS